MSEFEKQFLEIQKSGVEHVDYLIEQIRESKREGWKAALNWVRNSVIPEAWDLTDVDDFVEEELEQ